MKRIATLFLAICVSISCCFLPANAVTQKDIDDLKNSATDLSAEKKALQEKLNTLKNEKEKVMEKKENLDAQIAIQVREISNTESQIAAYAELIDQTYAELVDAQQREADKYALFCRRVRTMEEEGNVSYWSVLFKASSFTDLLDRLSAVNEIMDADQLVIDQLKALQEEISQKKAEYEQSKAGSEAAKADLVKKKSSLEKQRQEANKLIQELAANQGETEASIAGLKEEEDAIQKKIQDLSRKLAEEEAARAAANGKPVSSAALGGYIWPVSSHYITSTFGGRSSPGGIGSTNHKGIDIGRVGYTTAVKAAKAGTVIIAQRSSSYGNYVVISHGSGNTTLYGHMSSLKVSSGATVKQGDTIGITGSTGNSTGPHLHFEITENGVRINPLKYLTNYTLGD
jgi:murein DD-endopeptidase MepM/ murein hydrolase activator NlpD